MPVAPASARRRRAAANGALRLFTDDEAALAETRFDQGNRILLRRILQRRVRKGHGELHS